MKWLFKRKSLQPAPGENNRRGFVDLHSHVLPGIDDGAANLEESMLLLDGMARLGYETVVATPHFDNGSLSPGVQQQQLLIEQLNAARQGRAPAVLTGAEIPFDEQFMSRARAGQLPMLGPGPHSGSEPVYLLEFGFQPGSVPLGIEEALFRFQIKQGKIVVAHPERISDFQRDLNRPLLLIRSGCLLQVDLMSLAGHYGQPALRAARQLLEHGHVHLLASDVHKPQDLEDLEAAIDHVLEWDENQGMKLLGNNPRKVIDGLLDEIGDNA